MNKKIIITLITVVLIGIICGLILKNQNEKNRFSESSIDQSEISETKDIIENQDETSNTFEDSQELLLFQQAIENAVNTENEIDEIPDFLKSLRSSYSLQLISITAVEGEDIYQGVLSVTYADAADSISNYLEQNSNAPFDEEKLNKDISELVSNAESVTEEFEMYFVKKDEEIQPIFTEEIIDKMYGGIYSTYYEKLDEIALKSEGSEQ